MNQLGSFAPYGVDAIRCLFTEATPTRATLIANLCAGWPASQAHALLDELLALGLITPAVSDRARFRLVSDMLPVEADKPTDVPTVSPPGPGPRFSLFRGGIKNVKPIGEITLAQLHDELTGPRWKELTTRLRAVGRGAREYDAIKSGLDNVTPAGTFTPTRALRNLAAASGLIVLDFDKLPDVPAARAALLSDPALGPVVALLFVSPSGDGLKCIIPLDDRATHLDNFTRISRYLSRKYALLGLVADDSGKDVSRACFLCHDPHAYLSTDYQHPHRLAA
jgi:hypothetical protein